MKYASVLDMGQQHDGVNPAGICIYRIGRVAGARVAHEVCCLCDARVSFGSSIRGVVGGAPLAW